MWVNRTTSVEATEVVADCDGLTSRAGTSLLLGLADRLGLTDALTSGLEDLFARQVKHAPGCVLRDISVMLADGGDALTDLGVLRDQQVLFGEVASDATAFRAIEAVSQGRLSRVREARVAARARAWKAGVAPERVILDIDATLLTSHSEKEGAAPTYKSGYGFHPLLCFEATTGEGLAGILRPGNAGSNTAADHVTVLGLALAQLPAGSLGPGTLVRCDSGGATHTFLDAVASLGLSFSVGLEARGAVREACLAVPEQAWAPALDADGEPRGGAWVAELGLDLEGAGWPHGSRAICRKERPHPGAQLSFTDEDGHRFQVFLTNQTGDRIARLEQLHRSRAAVEDCIRCGKDTGMRNLPFRAFAMNEVWLELVLMATDLLVWAKRLLLSGELSRCEPKRLRHRLLHVAGRLVSHARSLRLRLPRSWPWAAALVGAFARLRALPAG